MARKSGRPGRDRTKYTATPKRGGPGRPPARRGPWGLLIALAFGGLLLAGAVQWTPAELGTLAATAGWTGARGELRAESCTEHHGVKGSVSYACSGPVSPREAAPGAGRGVAWLVGQDENPHGGTVAVDCPPTGDVCVRTGAHAVLEAVLQLYFLLGLYVLGLAVPLASLRSRRPAPFGRLARHRDRLLAVAGWTAVALVTSLAGVLIAVVAT